MNDTDIVSRTLNKSRIILKFVVHGIRKGEIRQLHTFTAEHVL